ncbi:microcephalin isoform X2 [Dendropsophus ebraccatus]|uniref:microcephalin isoform X2 n=1 Tax=Dendropsophus ebraccatus TaxID=150705 RepID=UPI0038319620
MFPMALTPGGGGGSILTGVVAFVDVWSSNRTENYSKLFTQQLLNLGAKVSKTFNKQVTHVVFKDGSQSTWDKAVKSKVKLVSVLWVEKCRETAVHVEESGYPAINTNNGLPQLTKKRKCMQPKDFVERTPENDRRLARKFNKLCKNLDEQKASVDIPILSFEDDGVLLYSPKAVVADRCNAMERRIQEMRNKRENLSPTASQMSQTFDFPPLRPSLGNSPSITTDSPHGDNRASLNASYDELFESVLKGGNAPSTPSSNGVVHITKEDPVNSVDSKLQETQESNSSSKRKKRQSQSQAKSRKSHRVKADDENVSDRAALLPVNDPLDVDITSMANAAVKRETSNFTIQISHKDQKSNKKVKATNSTSDNDSGSDACSSEKNRVSGLDYSSMANRLVALCKEKEESKKRGRRSLKSEVPAKNKVVKVEKTSLSSCNSDSEAFSNFEDYFTSSDLNSRYSKLNKFSLTIEPRRSPSPPPLTDCRKRRRSMVIALEKTCPVKKRKTIHSVTPSVSSPLESAPPKKNPLSPVKCVASPRKDPPGANTDICVKDCGAAKNGVGSKTSACDAISGLPEMFNEQRNKCTEESRKTEKSRKVARSLVMTSMSTENQNTVIQVVKKFGGFLFSDEVCETTTHVIAGSPRRTLNVILGISRGCWILSYDWVLWSLECGHWIPEEPYELSDHFPGAPICRLQRHLSAGEYSQDLFSRLPAIFISPSSQPPCDKLSEVLQLCGGKVCKTLRQAKHCIGLFTGKKPPDLQCLSEKWLLDSVTQHKLLPIQNYLLED